MRCYIKTIKPFKGHRKMMVGEMVPSWLERILLLRVRRAVAFVGSGTVWHRYPKMDKVPWWVARQLAELERKHKILT
jgi:hypothetical protein